MKRSKTFRKTIIYKKKGGQKIPLCTNYAFVEVMFLWQNFELGSDTNTVANPFFTPDGDNKNV